jgi:hypothetical protein
MCVAGIGKVRGGAADTAKSLGIRAPRAGTRIYGMSMTIHETARGARVLKFIECSAMVMEVARWARCVCHRFCSVCRPRVRHVQARTTGLTNGC